MEFVSLPVAEMEPPVVSVQGPRSPSAMGDDALIWSGNSILGHGQRISHRLLDHQLLDEIAQHTKAK